MEPYTNSQTLSDEELIRRIAYEQANINLIREQTAETRARAWMCRSIGVFALALVAETVVNLVGG